MRSNNKVIGSVLAVVAALFVLTFVMRFVLLSQYGMSGAWMFFALPFGGIGVVVLVLRLGLLNFGDRSSRTIQPWQHNIGVGAPPVAPPPPVAPSPPAVSQRLQELEGMRASGAISDAEYTAKREQIISSL